MSTFKMDKTDAINMEKDKLEIRNEVTIHASAESVWDALVNPEKTKQYMYGCETVSNWGIGDSLVWRGEHNGKPMDFVSGKIVELKPHQLMKYTVFDPNSSMEDIPQNHLLVTYQLIEDGNKTRLTVVQDGFENAENGQKRYADSNQDGLGWQPILDQIKVLVEGQ